MRRTPFDAEHDLFRDVVAAWLHEHVSADYADFEAAGVVPRDLWLAAGTQGLLCPDVPESYGGGGAGDWRFNAIVNEEVYRAGVPGFAIGLHNDLVVPYLMTYGTDEQKRRWLPGMAAGELIGAIAMSEPGTGSDLAAVRTSARRDGDDFIVDGSKTFISNGILADVVITVVRTDPEPHRGLSLLVIERDTYGFERGRNLDKVGLHAQDTAELHFDGARVPTDNLLGEPDAAFEYLMHNLPQERLVVAITAVARARAIFDQTVTFCGDRSAFGRPIGTFQANRFSLAELATELEIAQVFVDRCLSLHMAGELTASEAAMAKWWTTDVEGRVIDTCLQLHGGYGYMEEYPVARAFRDARVQRIYAGTNEIMKEIVGRSLGF